LISQLPSVLPASAWTAISGLMGQACSAISRQEESFDTLLQALPANAQDYNRMMTAVASIVEEYMKNNPNALADQVINYLTADYNWEDVVQYIPDATIANTDTESVKQNKVLASVFNAVVAKTKDFTTLFELLEKVVATVFDEGQILEVLARVKKNEILGYDDTKSCVHAALLAARQHCTETTAHFSQAMQTYQNDNQVEQAADHAAAASATSAALLGLLALL